MARISQIGVGRGSEGKIDGIVYAKIKGITVARRLPHMPAAMFKTPAALKRQAIFKLVTMHVMNHLGTLSRTISGYADGKRYLPYPAVYRKLNGAAFTAALGALAEQQVAGQTVDIAQVEQALASYATSHPASIVIGHRDGYGEVYLTGTWPSQITLRARRGTDTIVVFEAADGTTTTVRPGTPDAAAEGSASEGGNGNSGNGNSGSGNSGSGNSGSGNSGSGNSGTPGIPVQE